MEFSIELFTHPMLSILLSVIMFIVPVLIVSIFVVKLLRVPQVIKRDVALIFGILLLIGSFKYS